ncbi:MAG TPA: patatin-like phospholipase family protein [Pyrinomonadaceae bacterium]|jgi:predicted acylesterase/phospholipase RssA|nr:patatin-like phospholipase family protein [Pyrinomonadaceae bacterium]
MANNETENVKVARATLRGQSLAPGEMLALARKLKDERQFGFARRLLARALIEPSLSDDPALRLTIHQEAAVCTYKDPDLQADARLDRALDILRQSSEDINSTRNQETLGITGAIYKRKWELDNQKQQLERALSYYLRGYAEGPAKDQGYTAVNAAFVLDLLAHQEEEEASKAKVVSEVAKRRRVEATEIRNEVVAQVAPLVDNFATKPLQSKWWLYSTVAEAHFGLGAYQEAVRWLNLGRADAEKRGTSIPPWEYESTARQLGLLARIQDISDAAGIDEVEARNKKALDPLKQFFTEREVESAYEGKFGLALSGGGFRAALFHLGVLARLAELGVLRRIEVLSCVSGGSIIGAHYYLEVRKLLQTVPDEEINRQHYIDIVAKVRKDFVEGLQRNVRVRVAAELTTNLKMIALPKYTRTMRAGELYESEIFSRVLDTKADDLHLDDRKRNGPRWLNGLYVNPITPADKPDENFNFKTDNWRRRAKVPNLILNTTSLNTGHNWQFTASWMGEPPAGIDSQIDGNDRLRRLYYLDEDTPKEHATVRLGHAVGASSCVPGLFEPLMLDNLYPERAVQLVDGGVCDNQGVGSLLEQDCNVILVSDGSGQMGSENHPSNGLLAVPLRSNTILMARVREAQYNELSARRRAGLLRGFMFVHLKDDLDVDPIDWIGCLDPFNASDDSRPAYRRGPLTRYGIAKDIQELLAGVRTDLDSFSDVEAFALMTSAYRMAEHELRYSKCIEGFSEPAEPYPWDFLAVEEGMKGSGPKYDYLKRQLSVSGSLAFKIWKLSKPLKVTAIALAVLALAFVVWAIFHWATLTVVPRITIWDVAVYVVTFLLLTLVTLVAGKWVKRALRWRDTIRLLLLGIAMAVLGWLFARLHLHIFDPMFLRGGSLETFKKI